MTATLPTVLAADAAVPKRDALLDPCSFADALDRYLRRSGTFLQVVARIRLRARYHPGRSLRVLHELEVEGGRSLVAARTFPGDVVELARKARGQAIGTGALPPVIPVRELGAVAWVYPNDRKLKALSELSSTVAALLGRSRLDLQLVSWAPEKSVTARVDSEPVYAKAYAERAAARDRRIHDDLYARLAKFGGVAIPSVIASSGNVLVVEAGSGQSLAKIHDGGAYARYGQALAALHSLSPPRDAAPFERAEPARLIAAATVIGRARPDVADAARRLVHDLVERRPERTGWACLHGDAHPKNALDDGDRITLIDLEQVSAGDAAAEVGSVLASLWYRSLTGQLDAETAEACREAFLGGYAQNGRLPAVSTIAWHTAAALLVERAQRTVTRLRSDGLQCLPALVRLAQSTLTGSHS